MTDSSREARGALTPSASLLSKLGSIIVHADEGMAAGGHHFDIETLKVLLADSEVTTWIAEMQAMALLPVKRS